MKFPFVLRSQFDDCFRALTAANEKIAKLELAQKADAETICEARKWAMEKTAENQRLNSENIELKKSCDSVNNQWYTLSSRFDTLFQKHSELDANYKTQERLIAELIKLNRELTAKTARKRPVKKPARKR